MVFSGWRNWVSRRNPGTGRARPAPRTALPLRLETLEDRFLPSLTPVLLQDINPTGSSNAAEFTAVGGFTYFTADDGTHGPELWRTDGTPAGTNLVADINPGP